MDAMRAYLSRQSAISLLNMTGLGADTITGSMFSSQTSADSISLSDQSVSNSPSYANQIFASFSCSRLGKLSDFLTIILLSAMFYRTYLYVIQRRHGRVGPSMAPLLVKFWALYGITQFATELLSVYLAPFQTVWLISTLRAIILIVLLLGRRLQISETLYDSKLHPFYDSQAPEIERQLARTHQHWEDLNAAFRQLAKQILERVAMGGLSAILPIPSSHEAHSHTTSQHAPTSTSGKQSTAAPLPRESAPFPIDRQFFAGEPERRAETLRQSRNDNLRGAIQVAIPEPPKAAYENSRVLRQMFRHRSKSKMHQKGLPS